MLWMHSNRLSLLELVVAWLHHLAKLNYNSHYFTFTLLSANAEWTNERLSFHEERKERKTRKMKRKDYFGLFLGCGGYIWSGSIAPRRKSPQLQWLSSARASWRRHWRRWVIGRLLGKGAGRARGVDWYWPGLTSLSCDYTFISLWITLGVLRLELDGVFCFRFVLFCVGPQTAPSEIVRCVFDNNNTGRAPTVDST